MKNMLKRSAYRQNAIRYPYISFQIAVCPDIAFLTAAIEHPEEMISDTATIVFKESIILLGKPKIKSLKLWSY